MRSSSLLRVLAAVPVGILVGLVGTFMHRSVEPLGLVLALATVLAAGMFTRANGGLWGAVAYTVTWAVVVQVLSLEGPGGDVIVPAATVGYVWTYGGLVAALAPLLLPARWFVDDVRTPRHDHDRSAVDPLDSRPRAGTTDQHEMRR